MATAKPRKAVVFVVEGQTDKDALERILKTIYRDKLVEFVITSGDVTTRKDVDVHNVENVVEEYVARVLNYDKILWQDVFQIIHIIDTDGCFIPDSYIVEADVPKYVYSDAGITCKDRLGCIARNEQKQKVVLHLLKTECIRGVPYTMYYMSCNIDDALYGDKNLSLEEKERKNFAFQEAFFGQEKAFPKYLEAEAVNGVPNSYVSSWRYIQKDLHSVERHTNFHLYFRDNPYDWAG